MKQAIQKHFFEKSKSLVAAYSVFIIDKFNCTSIESLHSCTRFTSLKTLNRGTDQATPVHTAIYNEFNKGLSSLLVDTYRQLCQEWIDQLVSEYNIQDWAVQRYPSLRIQLPDNISVFEFHCDSDYNHPKGEINHFLALTRAVESAALQVEENLGWNDYKPLNLMPSESAILNTSIFKHGDIPNNEGYTRASIDFRAIPLVVLESQRQSKSLTKSRLFSTADYFIRSDRLLQE